MKLKHGKKYETAHGVVYRVRKHPRLTHIWDVSDNIEDHWEVNGKGCFTSPNLIRRHYKKPQPSHKLAMKPGDVVELVAWEDGAGSGVGEKITIGKDGKPDHDLWELIDWGKGHRPLFRVVSRA